MTKSSMGLFVRISLLTNSLSQLTVANLHLSGILQKTQEGGYMLCAPLFALVPLLWSLATQAQTQAACTFNFFSKTTKIKLQNGSPVFIQPVGINDFHTIVGYAFPVTDRGLIRWANGGVTSVKGTSSLHARNNHGTSIGFDLTGKAVLVNGPSSSPTITPIVLAVSNPDIVEVNGINKWGTIVGVYVPPDRFRSHGFKLWETGTTHKLDFPGAVVTQPNGINDLGTVVGSYSDNNNSSHGFIFHNGQWATLDYPHASNTVLVGITNTGKIIGNAFENVSIPFLYENGTFKVISIPNSDPFEQSVMSISPKQGLILGITAVTVSQPAFIAQCQ
jgi:probable HAF family extracellular repeat protein